MKQGRKCRTRGCGYRLPVAAAKNRKWCKRCGKERSAKRKYAWLRKRLADPVFLKKHRSWTRKWRDANPEKVREDWRNQNVRKKQRRAVDPDYREQVNATYRAWVAGKKETDPTYAERLRNTERKY